MQLIVLFLSALLSALSGAGGTLRAVEPYALAAPVTTEAAASSAASAQPLRPAQALPMRAARLAIASAAPFSLTPNEPVFAQRRRE